MEYRLTGQVETRFRECAVPEDRDRGVGVGVEAFAGEAENCVGAVGQEGED